MLSQQTDEGGAYRQAPVGRRMFRVIRLNRDES
jgi:hypothetical protein